MSIDQEVGSQDVMAAGTAVERARDRYREALEHEQEARHDTTTELNVLNEATREFDRLLNEFRLTVPKGADWNRPETSGVGR